VLAGFWLFAGTMHFVVPRRYEAIVPPYVPRPREVVYVSGAAELAGAGLVLHPETRRWAGPYLVALLAAVFPANAHMALHPDDPKWKAIPAALLWLRLPLQPLAGWWAWRVTQS
jgi:uncharacterized membrane protein